MKHRSQISNLGFNAKHVAMSAPMRKAFAWACVMNKRHAVGFDGGVSK